MSDLVKNPEDRFSQNEAHIYVVGIPSAVGSQSDFGSWSHWFNPFDILLSFIAIIILVIKIVLWLF